MNQKAIPGYENYIIYDNGEIYNKVSGHFLKGSIGENGYKYFRLSKNNKKKMFYCHRLVAEAFLNNDQNLPVVNHIDGNKLNNNVNNLEWVTYSENTKAWHDKASVFRRPTEYYTDDLEGEEWKPYSNYYVSNYGRVRHIEKNNLLKPSLTCGYWKVRLSQGGLSEDWMIHQLVWKLFSGESMPDKNKETIDHIDGDKLNNHISNLRKISLSENVLAALYETKTNPSAKRVAQYDLQGNFINEFASVRAAATALGLDSSTISKVCRGVNKTHGGFRFVYI